MRGTFAQSDRELLAKEAVLSRVISLFGASLISVWVLAWPKVIVELKLFEVFQLGLVGVAATDVAAKMRYPLAVTCRRVSRAVRPRYWAGVDWVSGLGIASGLSLLLAAVVLIMTIHARVVTTHAAGLVSAQVSVASAKVQADSDAYARYINEHGLSKPGHTPTEEESETLLKLLDAEGVSAAACNKAYALIPPPASVLDRYLLTCMPLLLTLILPTVLFARWRWSRQWKAWCRENGKCPGCGYDLRASADRCPECGTPLTIGVGEISGETG